MRFRTVWLTRELGSPPRRSSKRIQLDNPYLTSNPCPELSLQHHAPQADLSPLYTESSTEETWKSLGFELDPSSPLLIELTTMLELDEVSHSKLDYIQTYTNQGTSISKIPTPHHCPRKQAHQHLPGTKPSQRSSDLLLVWDQEGMDGGAPLTRSTQRNFSTFKLQATS